MRCLQNEKTGRFGLGHKLSILDMIAEQHPAECRETISCLSCHREDPVASGQLVGCPKKFSNAVA